jgi:murein endopeptidase
MTRHVAVALLGLLVLRAPIAAQQPRTITGTVRSEQGTPLGGVGVFVKGCWASA